MYYSFHTNSRLRAESLESRDLLAVFAGWTADMPVFLCAEEASTAVTTLEDIADPNDGLISLREAVEYAKDLQIPVTFTKTGICRLNAPIEVTRDLILNAESITFKRTGEGEYAAFIVEGARLSMTGGTITGFTDSGMKFTDSNSELNSVTVSDSSSALNGGGVTAIRSNLTCTGFSLYYNTSSSCGGGLFFDGNGASLIMNNCYVVGNKAIGGEGVGGGIAFYGGGLFKLSGSQINANRAEGSFGRGGGVYAEGDLYADAVTILGNVAFSNEIASLGGGFCMADTGSFSVSNSNISGNRASQGAGVWSNVSLTSYNTTIAGNAADDNGIGGISVSESAKLYNTIVSLNNGGNISENAVLYSCVVDIDPMFTSFTPYETADWDSWISEYWNLTLTEDSPAIDAGVDSYALSADGETLLQDDLNTLNRFNRTVDAGCYENQTVIVNTVEDIIAEDDYISLREAFELANQSWITVTVRFDPSVINTVFYLNAPLLLTGSIDLDGKGRVILDGNGTVQILNIQSGQALLNGLSFCHGSALDGGALYAYDTTLTISNCIFLENRANGNGGAISVTESLTVMTETEFQFNSAGGDGGAIYLSDSYVSLSSSRVESNQAEYGGGLAFYSSYTDFRVNLVSGSAVCENNAVNGGGIAVLGESQLKIEDTDITENSVTSSGAGLYNEGTFQSDRSRIAGNSTLSAGGGLMNTGTAILADSLIAGNRADIGSGVENDGSLTLYNVTVAGNTGTGYALNHSGTASVYNTIISLNNGGETNIEELVSSLVGIDPLFYRFTAYLPEEWTVELYRNWDFTPLSISPAVDAGNNDYVFSSEGWTAWADYAGNTRIINNTVDIGAAEAQNPPESPTIFSVVGTGANRHQASWNAVDTAVRYIASWSADGETWYEVETSGTFVRITGLPYGELAGYKVKAIGAGGTVSDWSETVFQLVCPIDIDGDGDISGPDRALLADAWLSEEGDTQWDFRCDIDGDGEISMLDRAWLAVNWLKEANDTDILYPREVEID